MQHVKYVENHIHIAQTQYVSGVGEQYVVLQNAGINGLMLFDVESRGSSHSSSKK